jgi:hypothetical protein
MQRTKLGYALDVVATMLEDPDVVLSPEERKWLVEIKWLLEKLMSSLYGSMAA